MATVKALTEQFYESYCTALAELNLQGPRLIVVALGGGADSQAVLDLTLRFRQQNPHHRYLAIHLDHYFHPDSPQWAEFLRDYCVRAQIDHIVEPLDVPVGSRQSKEAQGREARYARMAELTEDGALILLGQHLSDQSETFFLQLKRGSGPKGLASMAAVSKFHGARLLCRPLLGHSKDEIYAYARARELQWIEDTTNQDTQIERNFLRHDVLPVLKQRWPGFEHTVARSARLCAQQQALLDELLSRELNSKMEGNRLHLADLVTYSVNHQSALLRFFIQQQGHIMPSEAQLNQVLSQLSAQRLEVKVGAYQLQRHKDWLYLLPLYADVSEFRHDMHWPAENTNEQSVPLPDGLGSIELAGEAGSEVMALPISESAKIEVRFAQVGDTWQRRCGGKARSVSQLLKKNGIPRWQRGRWPVIWVNSELAWVASLGADARHTEKVTSLSHRAFYPLWHKGPKT